MSNPLNYSGKNRAKQVQTLFSRIANRYDLMNRIMTGAQDIRWRREVIHRANLSPGARLLDLGAGTGDLAFEALRQQPEVRPLAADFTLEMMQVGKPRGAMDWSAADALNLPLSAARFDAVVSGFLMRNVTDVQRALQEQLRVLKPGGRIVILDTTRPKKNLFSPLIWVHFRWIIPTLGTLLTGERDAYHYLPESTENFLRAEELAARMAAIGFKNIGYRRLMLGTIAIHWGEK